MEQTVILVDTMGGDLGPAAVIEGSIAAAQEYPQVSLILLGPEEQLQKDIAGRSMPSNISIQNAPDVITMDDEPAWAVRNKKESTIVVGSMMIKEGRAHALLSPGNTGAMLAAGLLVTGRIKGISRPGILVKMPTAKGFSYIIDVGANADCKPENLLDFAIMAHAYATAVEKVESPSVGLLSIGEEKSKGNELTKETYGLLVSSGLNFYGNVEGKDIPKGTTDIVVCDGFTGNIVLKLAEGLTGELIKEIKRAALQSALTKIGGALLKPALVNMKKRLDADEQGGTLLIGVDGVMVICHGSSSAKAIQSAIRYSINCVNNNVIEAIKNDLKGKQQLHV